MFLDCGRLVFQELGRESSCQSMVSRITKTNDFCKREMSKQEWSSGRSQEKMKETQMSTSTNSTGDSWNGPRWSHCLCLGNDLPDHPPWDPDRRNSSVLSTAMCLGSSKGSAAQARATWNKLQTHEFHLSAFPFPCKSPPKRFRTHY